MVESIYQHCPNLQQKGGGTVPREGGEGTIQIQQNVKKQIFSWSVGESVLGLCKLFLNLENKNKIYIGR